MEDALYIRKSYMRSAGQWPLEQGQKVLENRGKLARMAQRVIECDQILQQFLRWRPLRWLMPTIQGF